MVQIIRHTLIYGSLALVVSLAAIVAAAPQTARAASGSVSEAQTILTKFGIPAGPIDGIYGPQTARGLCAFRSISGSSVHRGNVDASTMKSLRSYNAKYNSLSRMPAPSNRGHDTYLVINETCQTMTYVEHNRYVRVMAVSTGKKGYDTPNGTYRLGYTERGWSCSTIYPESCRKQAAGTFASTSDYGNMYNKRRLKGGYFVHGSTSVPTYPASHGCVRVTVTDADWMYSHVGNNERVYTVVTGAYERS